MLRMAGLRLGKGRKMYRNSKKKRVIMAIIVIVVLVAMVVTGIVSAAIV